MRGHALAVALLALGGCAKLLGLDDTSFAQLDAPVDAPGICDGAPACVSSTGRSICGVLYQTGAEGDAPLRAASPTGNPCVAGASDGPCAFTVGALSAAELFAATGTELPGTIDDCGRFVIPDVDLAAAEVAVVFGPAAGFERTATLVRDRPATVGEDRDVAAFAVSETTSAAWGAPLGGYLVRYTQSGQPIAGAQVAKDNNSPLTNPPGTVPWAAYFSADAAFGALDPAATSTSANGTAFADLGAGTFSLDGFRTGSRCSIPGLQQVADTFIFVSLQISPCS